MRIVAILMYEYQPSGSFKLLNEAYVPSFNTLAFWQGGLKSDLRVAGQHLLQNVTPHELNIIHSDLFQDYLVYLLIVNGRALTLALHHTADDTWPIPIHQICDHCLGISPAQLQQPQALNNLMTQINEEFLSADLEQARFDRIRDELKATTTILRDNIHKIIEREERLESLLSKTQELDRLSQNFHRASQRLRRGCCPIL